MQSELKPCPLCQSDNVSQGATLEQSKQHGFVRCFDCGCSAPIAAWNARASDAEITRLTEALRDAEEREKGLVRLVERAQVNTPDQYVNWHEHARQALAGAKP